MLLANRRILVLMSALGEGRMGGGGRSRVKKEFRERARDKGAGEGLREGEREQGRQPVAPDHQTVSSCSTSSSACVEMEQT